MSVWDPSIELVFKFVGPISAGVEVVHPGTYSLPPDEVLEIYRIEVIPPVDTAAGTIKKLKYVTLMIEGKDYDTIRINSVMMPAEHPNNAGVAVDLGIPYLWRPITGRIPTAVEGVCPKVARGQKLTVKVVPEDSIASADSFSVILKAARVRGASKLVEVVGTPVVDASFALDTDVFPKTVGVSLETFDELPGGLRQAKPQVFPWVTYARNAQATTPNMWYSFEYPNYVRDAWMNLSWNLVNKEEAYLVKALGVIPHANSKALRLYIEGRITNPEFTTRPLPEVNTFYPAMFYDVDVNVGIKRAGPVFLKKPFLFHGVKGGIQVIDNGTSIPANGVEVHVYGVKFILR
jgi:hypothetical protein